MIKQKSTHLLNKSTATCSTRSLRSLTPFLYEYFETLEKCKEKFGNDCILLMQKGKFYECYEFDLPDFKAGDAKRIVEKISSITADEIKLALGDNSKPHSKSNPYMIGFPDHTIEKWKNILLRCGFIIQIADQHPHPHSSDKKIRKVTQTISIGTSVEKENSRGVVCVYIELYQSIDDNKNFEMINMDCGASYYDPVTSNITIFESHSVEENPLKGLNDLQKFFIENNAIEYHFFIRFFDSRSSSECVKERSVTENAFSVEGKNYYYSFLKKYLEIQNNYVFTSEFDVTNKDFKYKLFLKSNYQQQFLKNIFNTQKNLKNQLDIFDFLGVESLNHGRVSYLFVLQITNDYNENLVKELNPPIIYNFQKRVCYLPKNTIRQLNLISHNQQELNNTSPSINSLFSVINYTHTSIGKQFLKRMLLNPLTNHHDIQQYYNQIEELINLFNLFNNNAVNKNQNIINDELKSFNAIDKHFRKLLIHNFTFEDVKSLKSRIIEPFLNLFDFITGKKDELKEVNKLLLPFLSTATGQETETSEIINKIKETLKYLNLTFNFNDEKIIFDVGISFDLKFNENINSELYNLIEKLKQTINKFNKEKFNLLDIIKFYCNIDLKNKYSISENNECYCIIVTNTVAKKVVSEKITKDKISSTRISISTPKLKTLGEEIYNLYNVQIKELENKMFNESINKLSECVKDYYLDIIEFIKQLDYINGGARCAIKNKYFKPTIISENNENITLQEENITPQNDTKGKSMFKIKDVRHPIIEKLINEEYVTNDLNLGDDRNNSGDDCSRGLLLYGCNSIGKTSFVKAIGCNIILAQMGYYVPSHLEYIPYKSILTRLSGSDNMFINDSSFVVEMKELRIILKNQNEHSLVLCDELCRGTENISGTALTCSAILEFLKNNSTFIICTHMHSLPTLKELTNFVGKQLLVKHLLLTRDVETNTIIYDRKLKDGSGESIYGLEIAAALDLGYDFLKQANETRKELLNIDTTILSNKTSRYNSQLYVHECAMCKSRSNLHTHHIREQRHFEKNFKDFKENEDNNAVKHINKNSIINLIVLCEKCHVKLHRDKKGIIMKNTTKGLKYCYVDEN